MRGFAGGLLRSDNGTTIIETAILLPVFLTFMLGIFEFGRALWIQSSLQSAAEAAARCYVVNASSTCNSTGATQTYAASQVIGFSIPSGDFTPSTTGTCGNSSGGSKTVSASYGFSFVVPQLFPWAITLTAQAKRPC
jgi:Flp pilus assembly protein TadG